MAQKIWFGPVREKPLCLTSRMRHATTGSRTLPAMMLAAPALAPTFLSSRCSTQSLLSAFSSVLHALGPIAGLSFSSTRLNLLSVTFLPFWNSPLAASAT
jgi:hypothetical protein